VRTPEIFNPFASNINMYASFFNGQTLISESDITSQLLNYYKDAVFTIYDTLQKKDFAVNYISDQTTTETNKVVEKITLSNWHIDKPIHQYVLPKKATVICLHSLSSSKDLEQISQDIETDTIIYFIKTSEIFSQNILWKTVSRIFILPPKDELESIRNKWWLSSTRQLVLKNEKEMIAYLQKQNFTFTIL
jgi:ACT domain-containing protein